MNEKQYLSKLKKELFNKDKIKYQLKRDWGIIPLEAGVYTVFEKDELCYVGETGSLRGRQKDLTRTVNHTLRRSIGNLKFAETKGFKKATSRKKFPENIEKKLNNWMMDNIKISFMPIKLGRKELEEIICEEEKPKYNKKGRRLVITNNK